MILQTLKDFFLMGGYGFYVWTAYGVALVTLLINLFLPVVKFRKLKNQIKQSGENCASSS